MPTFNFYQDVKQTVWNRNYFDVTADSFEQAVEKLKEYSHSELVNSLDESIEHQISEIVFDTAEFMSPEDNKGFSTLEIFTHEGVLLFENGLKTGL